MTFQDLELIEPIQKALKLKGYTHPSPIQEQAIPILLNKQDLLGCAQTGTGKTAAFALPILQQLFLNKQQHNKYRKIKALIITPTRELAIQIGDSFTEYGKFTGLKNTVIFGGVKQLAQTQQLKNGIDILVATPGRLIDLMSQGFISLKDIEYFVLDEADHMLDMGFIHDIKKIVNRLPIQRQSLFFSATMPPEIIELSRAIVGNPQKITIKPEQATAEKVEQAVFFVEKANKSKLLLHLLESNEPQSTLVFSRTKHGADKIVKFLAKSSIKAEAIHGNKSQGARQRALGNFKNSDTFVLVATDIAARGIDVDDLALVVNYDLPNIPETYVHRIGRTGRAKASGIALSFCATEERPFLRDIQKLIGQTVEIVDHPFKEDGVTNPTEKPVHTAHKPSKNARKKSTRRKNDNFKRNPKNNQQK
ncbi:DEAD/DEAH box helicase [Lutibacter sp.]|uniref:DEAD/DEAH box helicase n=1 Tax=Lutibacter sp. TaxID=1925666 RepID=UPI001A26FA70|nr:DEAD/DEAH box helicase [Lutibacter sp.]MBI9041488.1 DEAD/DEAH box helicase [Lutibacter sp.]